MKKKILALVLSVLMVLSCCSAMVVFAEETTLPDNLGEDYEVTDVLEGNLFTDLTTSGNPQSDAHASSALTHAGIVLEGETKDEASNLWKKGDVSSTNWATGNGPDITSHRKVLDPWAVYADSDSDGEYTLDETQVNYTYALAGSNLYFKGLNTEENTTLAYFPTPDYGKNVVVRAPLTIKSGSGNVVMNVARTKSGGNAHFGKADVNNHEYPIEYNGRDQGITLSASGTTYLEATFAGNTEATTDPQYTYVLGMVMGSDAGITVHMDESEFYLGYEYAKDLTVTADSTQIFAGISSVTVDADVLNQLGKTGGLSQEVTWYALNEGRTEAVEGFTIVEGEDGTAEISADATVAAGKYTFVAVADEDAELVKGITISVGDISKDSVKVANSERTDNVITDNTGWSHNYCGITGFAESESLGVYTITAAGATCEFEENATAKHASAGLSIPHSKFDTSIYQPGATLVLSASVLSHNTNNPKLTWGLYQESYKAILPMEYPTRTDGMETSSTAWKTFGATVEIPEKCNVLAQTLFSFGFAKHEAAESGNYAVNINRSSLYLAPEAAADIKLTADKTDMYSFESINLDADVLNQVNYTGNLSQDITWYVLDAARKNVVSGITVTPGEKGTATVTADATVTSGTYNIVAVADANAELVKGVQINVTNLSKDFVKVPLSERTDNAIIDNTLWGQSYGGLTGFAPEPSTGKVTDNYTIAAEGAVSNYEEDATAKYLADGIVIGKDKFDTSIYQPGATLVFSASVISHNDNKPKVTWGMYQHTQKSLRPMEYPTRADGFEVAAGKWTTFGATVYVPETCDVLGNTLFSFGFSKDTREVLKAVNINRSSMYLAVEAPSDIKVTADKTTCASGQENVVTLDADILNQVNYTGNLSQDVTWYAMDEAKAEFIDEIQIVSGANGTATVTLPATLAEGNYNIIAVSDANKALVRTTTLTVEETQITETAITSDGTNITISAKDDISNAVLIFVKYDENGKMTAQDLTNNAVTVSANGTKTVAIPEDFTTGNVKVMLWKDLTSFEPLAAAIE